MIDLNPFTGIAALINGLIESRKINQWIRLLLSCSASGFVTFFFTFGSAGLAHLGAGMRPSLAAIYAFFESCVATSAIVFYVWRRSPLTKDMPISAPGGVNEAEQKMLEKVIVTYKAPKD
jgi:hypothetical protein